MDPSLFLLGVAKLAFGLIAGVLAIALAFRGLSRVLGTNRLSAQPGATAVSLLEAACVVALGILGRNTLQATYDALDLLLARHQLSAPVLARVGFYALLHLTFSFLVGGTVLWLGLWTFDRLTPNIDELSEVKKGNLGASIILSA
ncbi:MAG: DUF350 domain-containing protein, partial [Myxococcaceae bacterium]